MINLRSPPTSTSKPLAGAVNKTNKQQQEFKTKRKKNLTFD